VMLASDFRPRTSNGAANNNGNIDLGDSGARWKDLYLSGGVYLGGTGSANKLDDYEEGTFTPVFEGSVTNPTVSYAQNDGKYTKIGRVVYIEIRIVTNSVSGGSGSLTIAGLPFTQDTAGNLGGAMTKGFVYNWNTDPETFPIFSASTIIGIYTNDSTNTTAQVSDLNTGAAQNYTTIAGWYHTAS